MKKQKLHILPLETPFLRKIQTGVQYFNQNHYINFNESSLEIRTFNESFETEHWPIDSIFEKALKTLSLHNIKYLTKLTINIQASFLFKTTTLRRFGLTLAQNFKALNQLDLRFLSCRELNGERMRYLLDSLTKRMGHLTEVNLDFSGCQNIDDECFKDIQLLILKRCKNLQRLKVIISGDIVEAYFMRVFFDFEPDLDQRLRNYKDFYEYGYKNVRNRVTDEGGAFLCRGIARYLKRLRSLTFKMDLLSRQLGKDIWRLISNLSNLEYLNFCSSNCHNIDDEYLAKLTFSIGQHLKNLKSLSLDFPYKKEITERGYQQFADNFFSSLPSKLTYLALNLENSPPITDDIIKEIGLNIAKNLKSLRTLILSFRDNDQLTVRALLELTQIISTGLPSLKKFILDFGWCQGVHQFFSIVLPEQIKQFDLYLHYPQYLVDQNWKGLNRLSLSFTECVEGNSFLDLLCEPSLALDNLNELKLIYCQSHKLGDPEIENLASVIGKKLTNLTSLELGFSDCPLVTSGSILLLGHEICKNIKKLRHLSLSFYRADGPNALENPFYEGALTSLVSNIASSLEDLGSLTLLFHDVMDEEMNPERMLDVICFEITRNLKNLRKLTLAFNLEENIEQKHRIREKLCHIPMLYIY